MTPQVSIIMPVKNGESWLNDAIQSVVAQSVDAWELIVVDNASTDRSLHIAHQHAAADARITVLKQAQPGVSAARNVGLDHASGEFIAFLDADDRLPEHSLRDRLGVFASRSDVMFVDGCVRTFNADFRELLREWRPSFEGEPLNELIALSGSCFRGITWMIRRSHLGSTRFREGMHHSEDLAFYIDLALPGGCYASVNTPTYDIRRRPHSAMSNLDGLAAGYAQLDGIIGDVHPAGQAAYRKNVRSILVKSFVKSGRLMGAAKWWLKLQ